MSQSRWLTLANRIFRLYASTSTPSDKLKILADFIINVYALTWFDINCQLKVRKWSKAFVKHDQEDATSFRNFTKRSVGISGRKRRLLCTPRKRAYGND